MQFADISKNEFEIIRLLRNLPQYGKMEISPNREKGTDKFKVVITESKMLE